MEATVAGVFTQNIQSQAATLADTSLSALHPLGSFENYVFEFQHPLGPRVLRFTHSSHRSLGQVLAELDFVHYLAGHGVSVAAPIENIHGTLAAAIEAEDGTYFIVSIFHKADGVGKEGFELEPDILEDWGRITGQMHRLAKDYVPSPGIAPRYQWYDDPHLTNGANDDRLDPKARQRFDELVAAIKALPTNADSFGLVHTDLHHGNFFVHQQRLTAFDFDDCCYQHFAHDIAIPLYYALWKGHNNLDYQQFTAYFLKHFIKGYQQENPLPKDWQKQLPLFLELRSFLLYVVLTHKLAPSNATQKHLDTLEYCRKLATGESKQLEFDITELQIT